MCVDLWGIFSFSFCWISGGPHPANPDLLKIKITEHVVCDKCQRQAWVSPCPLPEGDHWEVKEPNEQLRAGRDEM